METRTERSHAHPSRNEDKGLPSNASWLRIGSLVRTTCLVVLALYLPLRVPIYHVVSGFDVIFVYPFDVAALLLVGLAAMDLMHSPRTLHRPVVWLVSGLALLIGASFALNPTATGSILLIRLCEMAAVVVAVRALDRRSATLVAGALCVGAMLQTGISVAQVAHGAELGLSFLGEGALGYVRGGIVSAQGTFGHPYVLAGFSILGASVAAAGVLTASTPRARALWLLATGLAIVPVGLTYSRMALLAAALLVAVLIWTRARWSMMTAAIVVAAVALPSALTWRAWVEKIDTTSKPSFVQGTRYESSRLLFARQSLRLIEDAPLLGVGPTNYRAALQKVRIGDEVNTEPVHDVPLLLATETGVPAGVLLSILVVLLGTLAFRSGPRALCLFLPMLVFFVLDHFMYDQPQGILMTGLWVGGVLLACASDLGDPTEQSVDETSRLVGR